MSFLFPPLRVFRVVCHVYNCNKMIEELILCCAFTANFIIVGTREKSRDFRRALSSFCKKYNNSENFSTQTEFQTI